MGNPIDDILDEDHDEEISDDQFSEEEISTDGEGEESGDSESDEEISTEGNSLSDYKDKLIEQYGFDVSDDRDSRLLKKMLLDHKEKLKAVRQKSTVKQQLDEANKKSSVKPSSKQKFDLDSVKSVVRQEMEVASLEQSGLSDDIIDQVKIYSKTNGVTLSVAKNSEYIKFLKEQEETKLKNQRASLSYKSKNSMATKDYEKITPENMSEGLDMTNPEHRKEFDRRSKFMTEKSKDNR